MAPVSKAKKPAGSTLINSDSTKSAAKRAPRKGPAPKPLAEKTTSQAASEPPSKAASNPKVVRASKASTKEKAAPLTNGETKENIAESPSMFKAVIREKPNAGRKRKATPPSPAESVASKRAKTVAPTKLDQNALNKVSADRMAIYVFGESTSGENGLGTARKATDVKRPRLNANLLAQTVGVTQIAVGGMHSVALTYDNRILTWGVNDQGALGRDTTWEGGLRDMADDGDSDSDSGGSDSGMNPHEATPTAIPSEFFAGSPVFAAVAASDSMSLALTQDGKVYGWGTFRSNDGILGYDPKTKVQSIPKLIPELNNITSITCGSNHVLALDKAGKLFCWGAGEQHQLGRRIVERTMKQALKPSNHLFKRNPIVRIGAGDYHSFAIDKKGKVWSWGLNTFAETGVTDDLQSFPDEVPQPMVIDALSEYTITDIAGGAHHSIAATSTGECLVWGRVDGGQGGVAKDVLEAHPAAVRDGRGAVRLLTQPIVIPKISAARVASGTDTCMAIDRYGRAWTWGFSANYQTGQGTDDDVNIATVIDNTATRGKKLTWGGLGGQFGMLGENLGSDWPASQ
ncbi:MAG: hypothetical protein M1814_000286 [Vezdaea aestivalis]|nr:MAG: hypothetical protein M1814_000286 [Vezdaea aestivalis]